VSLLFPLVEIRADLPIRSHGMSAKSNPDGTPNVLYVEQTIKDKWPDIKCRVICPIADPFPKHHGALGGFVRVYVEPKDKANEMIDYFNGLDQVEVAMSGTDAVKTYDLMLEREGDFIVISKSDAVVGSRTEEHDLSNLGAHSLRTHGGLSEEHIPLIMSRPVKDPENVKGRDWRNFDIYDLLLNH
jgi:phosphonoacetate hydrolase